jgi:ATPase subunit of ABC transporter with duplicated ATPase domains
MTYDSMQELPADMSALQYLRGRFPDSKEQEVRSHLGSFGITAKLALQPMGTLSGGQKVCPDGDSPALSLLFFPSGSWLSRK